VAGRPCNHKLGKWSTWKEFGTRGVRWIDNGWEMFSAPFTPHMFRERLCKCGKKGIRQWKPKRSEVRRAESTPDA